jgi:hypothetical protein
MVGKAQKSHVVRSELNSVFSLQKVDWWNPIRTPAIQSRSRHVISGLFQPQKWSSEARSFKVINGLQQVFKKWLRIIRSSSLAKGSTSKKRPSPHLHKVLTQSNKVSPQTLKTVLEHTSRKPVTQ